MKRFTTMLIAVLLSAAMWGQAQLTTRSFKFNDFMEKTTKVVLTGNLFYDSILKEEVANRWRLSPYEFCTAEEFESLKTDPEFYFLVTTKGQFKKEAAPGVTFLSLVKGGPDAKKGIKYMLEVVSIPLCPSENPDGREFLFLPAFVDILLIHTELAMQYDFNAYVGLAGSTKYMAEHISPDHRLLIAETDLSESISEFFRKDFMKDVELTDEETIDKAMAESTPDVLVSYVVTPEDPVNGTYCYKMIINPENKTLFWYKRSKISKFAQPGFLEGDLRRVQELLKANKK